MKAPVSKGSVLAVIAVLLVAAHGHCQQKDKDPQSSFEPRSNPGPGQKFLEKFVGNWEVIKIFHPRAGDPVRTTGECRQTMIHGGRFLQSEFVFSKGESKSTGSD